jgi:hypothetical protein
VNDEQLIERYRELMGKEPITRFPGDPDWEYKGGKAAFEELQRRMGILDDEAEPRKIEGQEELFDA